MSDRAPQVLDERLGFGFDAEERGRVLEILAPLNRHLAHWRPDQVDRELDQAPVDVRTDMIRQIEDETSKGSCLKPGPRYGGPRDVGRLGPSISLLATTSQAASKETSSNPIVRS
jgi:hypothetical protein